MIAETNEILLTGGMNAKTKETSEKVQSMVVQPEMRVRERATLCHKRYGHASVYLNGYVYVMGGFSQNGANEEIVSVSECEKFHPLENIWSECSSLVSP